MYRSLLVLAASAAFTLAAPISVPSNSLAPRVASSSTILHTVSFIRCQDDEDLEMGATPFGKRQDDEDEDLEMGATPFGKRQDDDEDLEMGATPFGKRQDADADLESGATPFSKREDDDEDLEMGGTPFTRRHDNDEDIEMGGTPFGKRDIYDKVDVERYRRGRLQYLELMDGRSDE